MVVKTLQFTNYEGGGGVMRRGLISVFEKITK